MDTHELHYFVTIAREENLTRASEVLFVSQPTLSKYIQKLESEVGLPLFQRIGKRMTLTYAGQRYLFYAERFLRTQHELESEMADILKSDVGLLRVGMPPFRCSFVLPAVLPAFHRRWPNVEVSFLEDNSTALDAALRSGKIDLAFYNLSEKKRGLCYETLREDRIFAILPEDHPLARRAFDFEGFPALRLAWLTEENFILEQQSQRLGQYILHELKEKHITPRKVLESSNIRAAASLAASGYGVAFLSGDLVRYLDPSCHFDAFALADCTYPLCFAAAWREGSYFPRYARDFVALTKEV